MGLLLQRPHVVDLHLQDTGGLRVDELDFLLFFHYHHYHFYFFIIVLSSRDFKLFYYLSLPSLLLLLFRDLGIVNDSALWACYHYCYVIFSSFRDGQEKCARGLSPAAQSARHQS